MSSESHFPERVSQIAQSLVADLTDVERLLSQSADTDVAYEQLAAAMDECLRQLGELNVWGPENRVPSSELWNAAGHLLTRGWLQNQARMKPRGYAGDYEMLARIYDNVLCDDPLGRLFDRYFQSQAAPQAVRNRMRLMADWIVERSAEIETSFHVAIVGSALGLEVRDALARCAPKATQNIRVTLLDLDPVAISFAQKQLSSLLPPMHLKALSANLFRLAARPPIAALIEPADLLLCPGLFDYLNDDEAVAMLRALAHRVAPGGTLTFFQFAPHNPTRAYMEWLGNWYLIYRDASQLRALVHAAGVPFDLVEHGAEDLGVCLWAGMTAPRSEPAATE